MARQLIKKILLVGLGIPIAFYGIFLVYLYIAQEDLIFSGTTLPPDYRFEFDVPFREINVSVDGEKINSLYFRQPDSRGLVFFLHGNGGNLETWTSNVEFYQTINYDMFMLDYRGYGKSTGQIESESQLHEAIMSQGLIAIHDRETRVDTDRGVGMMRKLVRDGIRAVRGGEAFTSLPAEVSGVVPTFTQDSVIERQPLDGYDDEKVIRNYGKRYGQIVIESVKVSLENRKAYLQAELDKLHIDKI